MVFIDCDFWPLNKSEAKIKAIFVISAFNLKWFYPIPLTWWNLTQVWLYYENTAKRKKTQINMHFWQEDDYESGHDFENATSLIIESSAETDTDFSDTDPLLLTAS